MTYIDFTTALAKLLVNKQLRKAYRDDATAVAARLAVSERDMGSFCGMDPDKLDRQASGLIFKRRQEVSQIIPRTWANLNPSGARSLFNDFAESFWPEGHQRHQVDSLAFCDYLLRSNKATVVASEVNWLRFRMSKRWFSLHVVRDLRINDRTHIGLQILYRRKNEPRWYALGIPRSHSEKRLS